MLYLTGAGIYNDVSKDLVYLGMGSGGSNYIYTMSTHFYFEVVVNLKVAYQKVIENNVLSENKDFKRIKLDREIINNWDNCIYLVNHFSMINMNQLKRCDSVDGKEKIKEIKCGAFCYSVNFGIHATGLIESHSFGLTYSNVLELCNILNIASLDKIAKEKFN